MKYYFLTLLTFLLPLLLHAEIHTGSCGDNLTYTLDTDDGALTIEGSGEMTNYEDESLIPWYSFRKTILSISLPDGLTSICDNAFKSSGLTSISFPNSLISIGSNAFINCSLTDSISIPNSVTSIGDCAFAYCSSITSVSLPNCLNSIGDAVFFRCSGLNSPLFTDNFFIMLPQSYKGHYTIPQGIQTIAGNAFTYCRFLSSISLPNSVQSIRNNAFSSCYALTSIAIPNSVQSIGDYAFQGCDSLTSIFIPSSVQSIGEGAFNDCRALSSITVEPTNTTYSSLDGVLFNKDQTVFIRYPEGRYGEYSVPNGVTSIEERAFFGCYLSSVTLPNSLTSIDDYSFAYCYLTTINIPSSIKSIGEHAFYYCPSLESVTIPGGVTSIGDFSFADCSALRSVILPSSLNTIGSFAFHYCYSLTSVTNLAATPQEISYRVFEGVPTLSSKLYVPFGTKSLYEKADGWRGFGYIIETDPSSLTSIFQSIPNFSLSYTIDGRPIAPNSTTSSIITIQRFSDGTFHKQIIR